MARLTYATYKPTRSQRGSLRSLRNMGGNRVRGARTVQGVREFRNMRSGSEGAYHLRLGKSDAAHAAAWNGKPQLFQAQQLTANRQRITRMREARHAGMKAARRAPGRGARAAGAQFKAFSATRTGQFARGFGRGMMIYGGAIGGVAVVGAVTQRIRTKPTAAQRARVRKNFKNQKMARRAKTNAVKHTGRVATRGNARLGGAARRTAMKGIQKRATVRKGGVTLKTNVPGVARKVKVKAAAGRKRAHRVRRDSKGRWAGSY